MASPTDNCKRSVIVLLPESPAAPAFAAALSERFRVIDFYASGESLADFLAAAAAAPEPPCAAIVVGGGPLRTDARFLDAVPSIRYIFSTTTTLDHVDLAECARRGVSVASTKAADQAIGLLHGVSAAERYVRHGSCTQQVDLTTDGPERVQIRDSASRKDRPPVKASADLLREVLPGPAMVGRGSLLLQCKDYVEQLKAGGPIALRSSSYYNSQAKRPLNQIYAEVKQVVPNSKKLRAGDLFTRMRDYIEELKASRPPPPPQLSAPSDGPPPVQTVPSASPAPSEKTSLHQEDPTRSSTDEKEVSSKETD